MDRREMCQALQRGVAVRTRWTPMAQPFKARLAVMLGAAAETLTTAGTCESTGLFFLQNYSSMVAVELLMRQLRSFDFQDKQSLSLLDACAVPGGKISLLLSLLQEEAQVTDFFP
ncbi:putative nucleolar protein [Trypanosoma rangeli]|uniref:Putative nucleolar protein n=1 Tax=Trypanosoma rangeli TaxID=5698 RepID=A0A3R7KGS5_TRYRA|nr:putative nucleolar protein [Trypanosoma rangeli]RNF06195.1 putative nucleolar protein [Trypanosoma rangeli]|eukprot:RNF06195.1 putative nucleolar protein [Trypanosoma rangeli]